MRLTNLSKTILKRQGHSLIVPYHHAALTKFENGVPVKLVRELTEYEKNWDFWTSSTAFYDLKPNTRGIVKVPLGETWVVERFGKFSRSLSTGFHLLLPVIDTIKAVKVDTVASMGVFAPSVLSKDGSSVDVYAVAFFKVTNPSQSTYYIDPETNVRDSERSAASVIRRVLASEAALLDTVFTTQDKDRVSALILAKLNKKSDNWGLTFESVDVRGAFAVDSNVPAKIRAYDPPHPDFNTPGHDLANDYWTEVLTPPFFQKYTYGSMKTPVTPIAPSMEWNIPSPPDFHHFNMQPKVAVAPEEEELLKLGIKH